MTKTRLNKSASYTSNQLESLGRKIERVTPGVQVDRRFLAERLLDLLGAVGRMVDDSEYSIAFQEFAASEPSHSELAKRFRAIAASDDPLNTELCSGVALAELNAAARSKWAGRIRKGLINRPHPIRGAATELLTDQELVDVREMASRLAQYHQSFVRRQQPNKLDQDTLVEGMADIYIEFTGLEHGRYELPHAKNARFIKFVYLAMRPFFGLTEASLASISKRWKRLKDLHNQGI
jgi:hypothetical protein